MAEQRTLDAERAKLYPKAVAIVKEQKRASVSLVQRRLRLSWDTARDLVELMLERKDVPVEWAPVVYQLAARRAPPALDAEGLPELPEPIDELSQLDGFNTIGLQAVYTAEQVRQAQRDAVAADRRARRPIVRTTLSPEMKAALEEAFKTRSTAALLPGGSPVFINYGDQPEDTAHLSCTACGGSGHIDDQQQLARQSAPEGAPVGMEAATLSDADLYALRRVIECTEKLDERPRPMCRDCADENGTCPNSGLECDMRALIANAKAAYNRLAAPTSASAQPADQNKMEKNDE